MIIKQNKKVIEVDLNFLLGVYESLVFFAIHGDYPQAQTAGMQALAKYWDATRPDILPCLTCGGTNRRRVMTTIGDKLMLDIKTYAENNNLSELELSKYERINTAAFIRGFWGRERATIAKDLKG